jgi:hypothetical protein
MKYKGQSSIKKKYKGQPTIKKYNIPKFRCFGMILSCDVEILSRKLDFQLNCVDIESFGLF